MSELRIMSPNGQYLNICDSDWYLRQDDGTWFLIDPQNDLRVRHGSNQYWLPIVCDQDVAYCPPEALQKCWPGYSGNFDGGEFKTGGETGYLICECDGTGCKTYTGHSPDYDKVGGAFYSTAPLQEGTVSYSAPTTLFGSVAEVSEMLIYAGNNSGFMAFSVEALDPDVRVRVYNDCTLLGDSNLNGDFFNVFFDASPPELTEEDCGVQRPANNFLTVRVDAPAHSRWRIHVGEVGVEQATHYQRPAPCFGTYKPNLPCLIDMEDNSIIAGNSIYEMVHEFPNPGTVHLDITVNGEEPVTISAIYNGTVLATLTTANSHKLPTDAKTLAFSYAIVGGDDKIVIRYEAPRQYNNWYYSIYCADQRGSRNFPMFCMPVPNDVLCLPLNDSLDPTYAIHGVGAIYNDMYYDYAGKARGDIVVEFFADQDIQFIVYQGNYPSEVMIGGTNGFVRGHQRFYFRYEPSNGTMVHFRIFGPCCPTWAFTASCPVPPPVLNIPDAQIVRGPKGQTDYLCFTATLENKTYKPVTFNWAATPLTAIESTDGTCTVTEPVPDSPYCNIVGPYGVQYGAATNDCNIGYSQARRISSAAHSVNCAVGGQYYVMECDFEFPYDGTYTFVGTADDNLFLYVNCELVATASNWNYRWSNTFTAKGGWGTISIMYQNVPNCTPGWAKMVILDNNGAVIFATNESAYTWRSKVGGITIEPPPVPIVYGADYNKSSGSVTIPECTISAQFCVPICGTDLMGPDVTFQITATDLVNAEVGDMVAIGTIINPNYYECDQNTAIAVLDNGPDSHVNRGARGMFVNKITANPGASYVMDADIDLPVSGLYTFYFYGQDTAELYVDCNLLGRVTNGSASGAIKIRTPMNLGKRKMYINYYVNGGKTRRSGYAALAIVDPLNRVVYASNAADWRGRVLDAGTEPNCDQFVSTCNITPTGGVIDVAGYGNAGVGYGASAIQSNLHAVGCAPGNTYYTLERKLTFPTTGTYTFRGIADDTIDLYIDCNLVMTGTLNAVAQSTALVAAGEHTFTFVYKNVPNCTPGYGIFCVLNPDGSTLYASSAAGWVSTQGSLTNTPQACGEMYWFEAGRIVNMFGSSMYYTGADYGYKSAELEFDVPADGLYYVNAAADDAIGVYVDCVGRGNGSLFELSKGKTKIQVRVYNKKAKERCWWYADLYNAAGARVYECRAAGWRFKNSDLDFTGLS